MRTLSQILLILCLSVLKPCAAQVNFLEGLSFLEIDPSNLGYNIASFKNEMPHGDTLGWVYNEDLSAKDTLIFNVDFEDYFNRLLYQDYYYNETYDYIKVSFQNIQIQQSLQRGTIQSIIIVDIAYQRKTSQGYSDKQLVSTRDTVFSPSVKAVEEQLSYAIENNLLKFNNLDRNFENAEYEKMLHRKMQNAKKNSLRAPLFFLHNHVGIYSFSSYLCYANAKLRDVQGVYWFNSLGVRRYYAPVLEKKDILPDTYIAPFYLMGLAYHHRLQSDKSFLHFDILAQIGVESFQYQPPDSTTTYRIRNVYMGLEASQSIHFFLNRDRSWVLGAGLFEGFYINTQSIADIGFKMSLGYHFK